MWFFCDECLKVSRDFSLFFENTMKMPCCFILSCRLSFSLPLHFRYIWVYKFFTVRSQNWWKDQKYIYIYIYIYSIISSARYICVTIFYLLWALCRIWNFSALCSTTLHKLPQNWAIYMEKGGPNNFGPSYLYWKHCQLIKNVNE